MVYNKGIFQGNSDKIARRIEGVLGELIIQNNFFRTDSEEQREWRFLGSQNSYILLKEDIDSKKITLEYSIPDETAEISACLNGILEENHAEIFEDVFD